MMTVQKLFLTFGGAGLSSKMPATIGTLAALPIGVAVLHYLGMETLFMLTFAVAVIAIFEINKYEKQTGAHDQPEIVIDEVVGMWLALMVSLSTAETMPYPYAVFLAIAFSFAAFRLFESWKPSTIGWINREVKGGLGVVMDDVLAGIAGGFLTVIILMGLEKLL